MISMNTKKCDTMSCKATATHRLSWVDEFEETVVESVCEPCGQGYVTRPRLKATLEPLDAPQSGYTHCACRDCMDVTVSWDAETPSRCSLCWEAGCEPYAPDSADYNALPGYMRDCQRDDAYEEC